MLTISFGFGSTALSFCFIRTNFWPLLPFFGPFGAILGPWELLLGSVSGSKTFLEPTYVDNQFWFWKYSLIFLF